MFKKIKSLWVILIGWFGFSSCVSHQNTTDPRSGMYGPPPASYKKSVQDTTQVPEPADDEQRRVLMYGPPPASFEPDRTVRLMYGVPPTRFETEKVEMEDGKSEDE